MAVNTINGEGLWVGLPPATQAPAFGTSSLIDATGEKAGFTGRIWTPNRGSKTISKIHWRFGTVTKAGGSALTVSIQTPLTTAYACFPDEPGTLPFFRAVANADANFASNTWYTSGIVSSDGTNSGTLKTVTHGDRIAVVIEYDGAGRLSADSVIVSAGTGNMMGVAAHGSYASLKTSGSWATTSGAVPNIIFEFNDGTFGKFMGTYPVSAINTHAFKQDTAVTDEHALEFQFTGPVKLEAVCLTALSGAITADFDVVLYTGTTALATATGFAEDMTGSSTGRPMWQVFPAETLLSANTTYRIGVRPNQTTSNITIYSFDVNDANHWTVHPMGTAWKYATRVDLGSWAAATATRRLVMGLLVSGIDDGVQVPSFNPFTSPVIKAA